MEYIKTWKEVVLKPAEFYWKMPSAGGYAEPLTFAAINYVISWLLSVLASFSILTIYGSESSYSDLGVLSALLGAVLLAIFTSFILQALVANFLYKAMGGTGNLEGTLRLSLYASAALIFSAVPFITPVALIYELYLLIVDGMIVHTVSMHKSMIIICLSFFLPAVFVWILTALSSFA
ncbi:YIP1 family protein [Methanosarcina acetivorans]|uniref:Yip1 domain-containing protein n=1 Tax=Methanosarcina acetivorans (strain ATCC 35395 / DSM 2834 / JCM 12185 / C2A) TaxID=188937 RepID=Q8TMF0_METAC|nr:YIP1 family protein [Methanosarcina acetivorans]AAM06087.1 predicted protein [Methanosarcina acetivorans C2A]